MLGIEKFEDYPHVALLREFKIEVKELPNNLRMPINMFGKANQGKPVTDEGIVKSVKWADAILSWYEKDFDGVKKVTEEKIETVTEIIVENKEIIENKNDLPVNGFISELKKLFSENKVRVHSDYFLDLDLNIPLRPLMGSSKKVFGEFTVTRKAMDSYLYISKN